MRATPLFIAASATAPGMTDFDKVHATYAVGSPDDPVTATDPGTAEDLFNIPVT